MSASILLSLVLLSVPAAPPRAAPPGVFEPSSGAWAVVHAGQLWVCWRAGPGPRPESGGNNDCWRRVELLVDGPQSEDLLDEAAEEFIEDAAAQSLETSSERWRLGFWGPRSLWIERGDQRWRVDLGHQRATITDEPAPVRLSRPRASACGPRGQTPALVGGRLAWQAAPQCPRGPRAGSCVAPPPPRVRRALPLRVRAGIQLSAVRSWTMRDDRELGLSVAAVRPRAAVELSFVVELGFDLSRARTDERARALLARRERGRSLPAVVPGPLAARERRALTAAVCGSEASP
ncbi:hypothetical protein [Enhygromyxa salina]|uniref:hypothetical protein n=1 Tax=Enhygromyxa salina TaxID=215803 RepID=UPI0011B2123B|nr:hypothetical protein [Enhygromyxa salina]